jgi:FkbM family methyltransferase
MACIFLSRADEERLLAEFLPEAGFFVDVGANDPFVESQSFFLEQRGWNGILIEPQPILARRLSENRKAKVVLKACGSPHDVGKTLPLRILGTNAALFPERVFENVSEAYQTVDVELDTLDNILNSEGVRKIDFLSLDIEGYEVEALQGFSMEKYSPLLVLIEDHLFNLEKHQLLTKAGYRWVRRTQNNNWYVPREHSLRLSALDRLALFRKMYIGMPFRRFKKWIRSSTDT